MIRIITITILLLVSSTQYSSAYTLPSASFQRTNPRGTTSYTTTKTALASSSHHDDDFTSIHGINEQLSSINSNHVDDSSKHVFRTSNAKLQPSRRDAIESFLSIATAITTTTATLSSPSSALAATTAAAAVPIPPQSNCRRAYLYP